MWIRIKNMPFFEKKNKKKPKILQCDHKKQVRRYEKMKWNFSAGLEGNYDRQRPTNQPAIPDQQTDKRDHREVPYRCKPLSCPKSSSPNPTDQPTNRQTDIMVHGELSHLWKPLRGLNPEPKPREVAQGHQQDKQSNYACFLHIFLGWPFCYTSSVYVCLRITLWKVSWGGATLAKMIPFQRVIFADIFT